MSIKEIFNSFPKDIQILIFSQLTRQEVGLLCFYNEDLNICKGNDRYWKMKLLEEKFKIEDVPSDKSYKDLYEDYFYKDYIGNLRWNANLVEEMLNDELFLAKYIEIIDKNDNTMLSYLAYSGSPVDIKKLIKYGANVNHRGYLDNTPLMHVLTYVIDPVNHNEIVKILLDAKADVNLPNINGITPLMKAVENENEEIVSMLLLKNADVNATNYGGRTPLMYASHASNQENIKKLISAGANIDAQDDEGKTALMYASGANYTLSNPDIRKLLLELGANPEIEDNEGLTAADYLQWEENSYYMQEDF
jgi:ankyrin repeat protein